MFEDEEEDAFENDFEKMPLYKKAWEIMETVESIVALIPEDEDNPISQYRHMMRNDALIITAKIAGASGEAMYSIKMQNASLIRNAAMELVTATSGLEMFGMQEERYLNLLRDDLEEFRIMFVDWVEAFDPWDYIIDRWGLFNPPGVSAHDKDPDEDIPFDPNDHLPSD